VTNAIPCLGNVAAIAVEVIPAAAEAVGRADTGQLGLLNRVPTERRRKCLCGCGVEETHGQQQRGEKVLRGAPTRTHRNAPSIPFSVGGKVLLRSRYAIAETSHQASRFVDISWQPGGPPRSR
jgi:hypothetical protein